jgi:small subunit ribosomal protein S23e
MSRVTAPKYYPVTTPPVTTSQTSSTMGKGKPAGLNAARKLRIHRRENRWADEHFRKRALGTAWKSSPLKGASHGKGIVLEKIGIEAKQPNSAVRKCVRVQLIKNGKKYAIWYMVNRIDFRVTSFVPNDGCLNFIDENDGMKLVIFLLSTNGQKF